MKHSDWDVLIDPNTRTITLSHKNGLDIAPTTLIIPITLWKSVTSQLMETEVKIEDDTMRRRTESRLKVVGADAAGSH